MGGPKRSRKLPGPITIPLVSFLPSYSLDGGLPFHRKKRRRSYSYFRQICLLALVLLGLFLLQVRGRAWRKSHPIYPAYDWIPWSSVLSTTASYPVNFKEVREYERRLPQHDTSLSPPEGINGRTLKFSNEVWGLGLNNQLNDRFVLSHLAYLSNRSYVFYDMMFEDEWENSTWYPLNTFISGPTAGGPFPASAGSPPRAISTEYWLQICPQERRTVLDVEATSREFDLPKNPDALLVLDRWAKKLKAMPETCIEISYRSKQLFDFYFFGSPKSLALFPILASSPVVTHFRWSNIVLRAVARNIPLIIPAPSNSAGQGLALSPRRTIGRPVGPVAALALQKEKRLSNVLALHIRRGDYGPHCRKMAKYSSGYNSWNLLPSLPDVYTPPREIKDDRAHEEFMKHCWPTVEDIVQRVQDVKRDHEERGGTLKVIYILTNDERPWIDGLIKRLLNGNMGWERVTSTCDLALINEPEIVASQAVDMEIARQAAVFVGNGFSTMSANIHLLRLISGKSAQTTRFW